ncbi:MAG TPA: hypothetical protein VKV20_20080 [Ktedonobacteraceae bacterium]|jgi:hypothetical protein|nr:hypothetical protein [Ktedonobacteraceae bacterium]
MPGERSDNRQSQQKQPTGPTRRTQINPSPYTTGMVRRGRETQWEDEDDLFHEEDSIPSNPPRPTTSTIRWSGQVPARRATREMDTEMTGQNYPVPPRRTASPYAQTPGSPRVRNVRSTTIQQAPVYANKGPHDARSMHWMLYVGVGMIAALALWVLGSSLLAWGTAKYDDIVYGYPRTFQTDAVVGHGGDSKAQPSHFIAMNLHGQVIIIELMAGNPAKSINYTGPDLFESGGDRIPVTLEFRDVTGDGKPDMLVHIQNKVFVFVNDGTKFRPANANDKIHL